MRSRWTYIASSLLTAVVALTGCGSDDEGSAKADEPFVCEPSSPSPSDEFAMARAPDSARVALAKRIADRFMEVHPADTATWDWGDGTLMFSMTELYRVTGDTRYRDYYRAYIEKWLDKGYDVHNSDTCPSSLAGLAMYRETCEERYQQPVQDVFFYLEEEAPRTDYGGINHLGDFELLGKSIWLDSLYMFGSVGVRWAELTGKTDSLAVFREQFPIFVDKLQDEGGLFAHADGFELSQDKDIFWARGNGWVTAATYDYLRVTRELGGDDALAASSMKKQVEAIIATQDPETGLWWTLMNRPGDIYLETSATALFALGMARGYRIGALGDEVLPVIDKAMAGVESKIVDDDMGRPVVTDISGPTTAGNEDDYGRVDLVDDIHYGVGAVLLALVETSGL